MPLAGSLIRTPATPHNRSCSNHLIPPTNNGPLPPRRASIYRRPTSIDHADFFAAPPHLQCIRRTGLAAYEADASAATAAPGHTSRLMIEPASDTALIDEERRSRSRVPRDPNRPTHRPQTAAFESTPYYRLAPSYRSRMRPASRSRPPRNGHNATATSLAAGPTPTTPRSRPDPVLPSTPPTYPSRNGPHTDLPTLLPPFQ